MDIGLQHVLKGICLFIPNKITNLYSTMFQRVAHP